MWICPKCKESIEDQFDSCWKCAGSVQTPTRDMAWLYPAISVVSYILFSSNAVSRLPPGPGGALLGLFGSVISVWAFLACPMRHWFAKTLTLLFLIGSLFIGVATVGSFLFHTLGMDAK
jgi:hypothetical protein